MTNHSSSNSFRYRIHPSTAWTGAESADATFGPHPLLLTLCPGNRRGDTRSRCYDTRPDLKHTDFGRLATTVAAGVPRPTGTVPRSPPLPTGTANPPCTRYIPTFSWPIEPLTRFN